MIQEIIKGLMIGFAAVAPIGMQNLFVFNNALTEKLTRALFYVLFIWLADVLFELAAFYGMGALIATNEWIKQVVMIVGGGLVIYIAVSIIRQANSFKIQPENRKQTTFRVIIAAFTVVWGNPQAIIDGSLMLGALRGTLNNTEATYFIMGVLTATFLWFFGITFIMGVLKSKLPQKTLVIINLISGLVVLIYGFYLIIHALMLIF